MSFPQLDQRILKAVAARGYTEPTPIQARAIPPILEGKDLLGIAQTGTGKTAAFVLPILQLLDGRRSSPRAPRVIILAPTRELAAQIAGSCEAYGAHLNLKHACVIGGVDQRGQVNMIARGADIVIATPGRLLDLLDQRQLTLQSIEILVLDEADRMLDMGFIHDIRTLLPMMPKNRQTLLFSATMPTAVARLADGILRNPVRIETTPPATTVDRVEQRVLFVEQPYKDDLLIELLQQAHLEKVLVFTRTKHRADKIVRKLKQARISSGAIHGDKSQSQRVQALSAFQSGKCRVLVASDIAARGIDIKDISHVINYDLPSDIDNYVHRIGRTARAGMEGTAYSFCSGEERAQLRAIEKKIRQTIQVVEHKYQSTVSERAQAPPRSFSRKRYQGRSFRGNRKRGRRR